MLRSLLLFLSLGLSFISYAHPPWGIVIDRQGNIYFPDIQHNGMGTLWKYTPNCQLIPVMKNFHCHNVSIDDKGNIYSAHGEGHHCMIRISLEGKIDTLVNTTDINTFSGGNATVGSNGDIYFGMDKHTWKYAADGETKKVNQKPYGWNQATYVDKNGNVFAPDISGSGEIWKTTPKGVTSLFADHLITELDRPRDKHNDVLLGMAEDDKGNFYICETAGTRIIRIDDSGNKTTYYTSQEGWTPSGLFFRNNETYILEWGGISKGPQITKVDEKGHPAVIFNFEAHSKK